MYQGWNSIFCRLMAKDPYSTLGVSRDASQEDIKKAYRKMSKEWHPDKHKGDKSAEDKFKEINQAYEVLSDETKRRNFDQFGSAGGPGGGFNGAGFDFNGADFGDIFGSFFGGSGRAQAPRTGGQDREIELTVDFADIIAGSRKTFRLPRLMKCDTCSGNGAEPGSAIITCKTCAGTGQTVRTVNSFFGQIQQRGVCQTCEGSGKVPEKPCRTCSGAGRVQHTGDVTVDIPAGIDNGQTLRIRQQGDAGLRGESPGDLYVHLRIRPDPRFERDGSDIRSQVTVPVIDAILGGEVEVETVLGATTVQVPEGMQPGQVFRIRGKGLPHLGSSKHGDHYVEIGIEVPKKLSRSERKILEDLKDSLGK